MRGLAGADWRARRYALMLVCMGLGALLANGATGPLAALATLVLPPELKSFALSVYEFLVGLLGPAYSVVMGIGLQARAGPCLQPSLSSPHSSSPFEGAPTGLGPPARPSYPLLWAGFMQHSSIPPSAVSGLHAGLFFLLLAA